MLQPVNKRTLAKWEVQLDDINSHCYLPSGALQQIFEQNDINDLLSQRLNNEQNISYLNARGPISLRYINDAYVWWNVLQQLHFDGSTVMEIGPGTSRVVDMALALGNYSGQLVKVDYTNWQEQPTDPFIRKRFNTISYALDITQDIKALPQVDLIVMNHFIDDLFMGIWAQSTGADYFGAAINRIDENTRCWNMAMQDASAARRSLNCIESLVTKVAPEGFVIIKSYPSGFETHFRQVDRVNFTFDLTNRVAAHLRKQGLHQIEVNLGRLAGPDGSRYPHSFLVFCKSTV